MRICLVTGSRNAKDPEPIYGALRRFNPDLLLHGGATGADALAAKWAEEHSVEQRVYKAKWEKYGRAAGPIRNRQMVKALVALQTPDNVVAVLAFPIGRSIGTRSAMETAWELGVPVRDFSHSEEDE